MSWGNGHEDGGDLERALADLSRWVADARVEEAAAARSRQRWLRAQAQEEANMAGLMASLGEQDHPLTLATSDGRSHTGRLLSHGRDFYAVEGSSTGRITLIASRALAVIRPHPSGMIPSERRAKPLAVSLDQVLGSLAGERRRISVVAGVSQHLAGELRSVGDDVMTLLLDGEPPTTAYVQLERVSEVSVLGSG